MDLIRRDRALLRDNAREKKGIRMSVEEFDRLVIPYIERFYELEVSGFPEEDLVIQYRQEFDPTWKTTNIEFLDTESCESCGSGITLYDVIENKTVCETCGHVSHYIDTKVSTVFSDTSDFTCFSYKPINHLNEFLSRFQAKESSRVPESVITNIMRHLHREGMKRNPADISYLEVQAAQRKLRQSRYYNQTMQIWSRITGKSPLRIDPNVEDKIKLLFNQLKSPFKKHCPKERKNFLSYPYTVYKICQLLGCNDILPYLNLLKGEDKLRIAEDIFQKICRELGWPFIPIQTDCPQTSESACLSCSTPLSGGRDVGNGDNTIEDRSSVCG